AGIFTLTKWNSMVPLSLVPPCKEKFNCPEDTLIDAILVTKGTRNLGGSYAAVDLGDACHSMPGVVIPNWVGFVNCSAECSEAVQSEWLGGLGMDGLVVHSADGCSRALPQIAGVPTFSVNSSVMVSLGWLVRIYPSSSDTNWLALRLVLGFLLAVVLLTSLTLWWLKPWRHYPRPRIYATPREFNPKSILSQTSLDVFPTLSYSPADRRKILSSTNQTPISFLADQPSTPLNRSDSDPIRMSNPTEDRVEAFEHYFCDTLCAICLSDYEAGDRLRILTCRHAFHVDCIDPWLLSPTAHSVCPTCKSDLSAPLGLPALPLQPALEDGPIVRFEEILGIAMPVLIYPDDPEFQTLQRHLNSI
ncbi:hypothetical protein L0F63_003012, partial [Massospora cicadina]